MPSKEEILSIVRKRQSSLMALDASLADSESLPPDNYKSLRSAIITQELQAEIKEIRRMLVGDDFEAKFKERCRIRSSQNESTSLSFTEMPTNQVNSMYWEIAMLFEPKTMGEMLGLLMPQVTERIEPEYVVEKDSTGLVSMRNVRVSFKARSTATLDEPPSLERLGDFVISGNQLLDVKDMAGFNFVLHQNFYKALNKNCPALAARLYQHNYELRKLSAQLSLLQGKGQTPFEAITALIRELQLGGTRMTGSDWATDGAQDAFESFKSYLEALPVTIKEPLMLLSVSEISVRDVIKDLDAKKCVETAAQHLQFIIKNPTAQALLHKHPTLPVQHLKAIAKEYDHHSLPTKASAASTRLPEAYLQGAISKITINSHIGYVFLLLNFPPLLYTSLLQHARIMPVSGASNPELPKELADRIREGILNEEQKRAFFGALFSNYQRWGFYEVITFYRRCCGSTEGLTEILREMPPAVLLNALQERDGDGLTVLHKVLKVPEWLRAILVSLPERERLNAVLEETKDGLSVLHACAAGIPESLRTILELMPEKTHFEVAKAKLSSGYTVLHLATRNPESFRLIMSTLSESEQLMAWNVKNTEGLTVRQLAISDPESLKEILSFVPSVETIKCKVTLAQMNYEKFAQSSKARTFFSGDDFLVREQRCAKEFERIISEKTQEDIAIEVINAFLVSEESNYYNPVSFTSFLLDALKGIEDSPWTSFSRDSESRLYDKDKIIAQLNPPSSSGMTPW